MRAPFEKIKSPWRNRAVCLFLVFVLSGCQMMNNKWIRIRRGPNPDVQKSKLRLPSFVGPKERVEKFFIAYQQRDWKSMEGYMDKYSDLRFLIKEGVEADFKKYVDLIPDIKAAAPTFNDAQDKAEVSVRFSIEKIDAATGSLHRRRGEGSFVLTEKGNWDILGYVGDPFWGEADEK